MARHGEPLHDYLAIPLAACGATVIVLGRNLERCQKVADEINAGGGKADAISGDVTDEAAMLRVKDEIAKKYGGLNILINAAGGAVKSAMVPQDQMADPGEKTFFEVGADEPALADLQRDGLRVWEELRHYAHPPLLPPLPAMVREL